MTRSFGYDSFNRLTSASRSDGRSNYSYNIDSFGNMQQVNNLAWNPAVSFNTNNQLQVSNSYIYDVAGNLTSTGPTWQGGHSYSYDAKNQIANLDGDPNVPPYAAAASYLYDADGNRSMKWDQNEWIAYARLNGQVMAENVSDDHFNDFIYANGKQIVRIDGQVEAIALEPAPTHLVSGTFQSQPMASEREMYFRGTNSTHQMSRARWGFHQTIMTKCSKMAR